MSSWKYITIVVIVLIAGTLSFGYWALNQFHLAFNNFDLSYKNMSANLAEIRAVSVNNNAPELVLPETLNASATPDVASSTAATTTPRFSINSPKEGDILYIGCKYSIEWSAPDRLTSISLSLVNAGTDKAVTKKISGLAESYEINQTESIEWKVGSVLPDMYYLLVSKMNKEEAAETSQSFRIKKIPEGETVQTICG